jgi:uncharacterized membrane protein YjjP (DUF1212 family)
MKKISENEIEKLGKILLEIGALLMSSGASSNRIRLTVTRISDAYNLQTDLLVTHRALTLTINDEENKHLYHSLKRTSPHGVNFRVVSGISRMSWRVVDEDWTVEQIEQEIKRLTLLPHYPKWLVLPMVGVAGAAFCRVFGGSYIELGVTFLATFAGLLVRMETTKHNFNPYLCIFFAAFAASFIASFAGWLFPSVPMEHASGASVLFLVPGVHFINSFSDFIDGNLQNGLTRALHSLIISFSIALGLVSAHLIYLH